MKSRAFFNLAANRTNVLINEGGKIKGLNRRIYQYTAE